MLPRQHALWAAQIAHVVQTDPFSGHLFLFRSKRAHSSETGRRGAVGRVSLLHYCHSVSPRFPSDFVSQFSKLALTVCVATNPAPFRWQSVYAYVHDTIDKRCNVLCSRSSRGKRGKTPGEGLYSACADAIGLGSKLDAVPPPDIDGLSPSELKRLNGRPPIKSSGIA